MHGQLLSFRRVAMLLTEKPNLNSHLLRGISEGSLSFAGIFRLSVDLTDLQPICDEVYLSAADDSREIVSSVFEPQDSDAVRVKV